MKTVGELMTPDVKTVASHVPVSVVLKKMRELGIRHIPVREKSGRVVGVATDYELYGRIRDDSGSDWVGSVITPSPRVASPSTTVLSALEEQLESGQHCTLVISPVGEPLGVFTLHDGLQLATTVKDDWEVVGQVMTTGELIEVGPKTPSDVALDLMFSRHVHHLLVVEDGSLLGVLSHRDLAGQGKTPVIDVCTKDIYHIDELAPLGEAARGMLGAHIGCLPVVSGGEQLVGLLTRTDLLRSLVKYLQDHDE